LNAEFVESVLKYVAYMWNADAYASCVAQQRLYAEELQKNCNNY